VTGRYGKGFLETGANITILHLKGAPCACGYQHGVLLADRITSTVSMGLTGAAAVALSTGVGVKQGLNRLRQGMDQASGFLLPELREELHGMADALREAGAPLTREAFTIGCCSFSAWGTAIRDGKLLLP
jgi:hypothetical protein